MPETIIWLLAFALLGFLVWAVSQTTSMTKIEGEPLPNSQRVEDHLALTKESIKKV